MTNLFFSSNSFIVIALIGAIISIFLSNIYYKSQIWMWIEPLVIALAIMGIGFVYSDSLNQRKYIEKKEELDRIQKEYNNLDLKVTSSDSKPDLLKKFYYMLRTSHHKYDYFCQKSVRGKLCKYIFNIKHDLDNIIPMNIHKNDIVPAKNKKISSRQEDLFKRSCKYILLARKRYKEAKYLLYSGDGQSNISTRHLDSYLNDCTAFYGKQFYPQIIEKEKELQKQKSVVAATDPNSPEYINSDLYQLKNVWWHFILLLAGLLQLGRWNAGRKNQDLALNP